MLAPMAQITCITTPTRPPSCSMPQGAKLHAVETTQPLDEDQPQAAREQERAQC